MLGCVVLVAASPGVQLATTQVSPAGQTDSGQPADPHPTATTRRVHCAAKDYTTSARGDQCPSATRRSKFNTSCLAEAAASGTESEAVFATRGHAERSCGITHRSYRCRNPKLAALLQNPHIHTRAHAHAPGRRTHHTPARTMNTYSTRTNLVDRPCGRHTSTQAHRFNGHTGTRTHAH